MKTEEKPYPFNKPMEQWTAGDFNCAEVYYNRIIVKLGKVIEESVKADDKNASNIATSELARAVRKRNWYFAQKNLMLGNVPLPITSTKTHNYLIKRFLKHDFLNN